MGPDPEPFFQVDGMEDEAPSPQTSSRRGRKGPRSTSSIPAFHRPVQPVEAPLEIAFLVPRRVDRSIGLPVVGLLEDLESADPVSCNFLYSSTSMGAALMLTRRISPRPSLVL